MIDPRHPLYDLALATLSLPAPPKQVCARPQPVPVRRPAPPVPDNRTADSRSDPCA